MDFGLSDEERMILQTVREFVRKEVAPLLTEVQKAEIRGERFPDRGHAPQRCRPRRGPLVCGGCKRPRSTAAPISARC